MQKSPYSFVLDCSVTMAWCFEDESTEFTDWVLEKLSFETAIVPTIWSLEVANVLLVSKKNKRLTAIESSSFINALFDLKISVDSSTTTRAMHSIYALAHECDLSVYDAAYLELALREQIPLFTLDKKLLKAASNLKVSTNRE